LRNKYTKYFLIQQRIKEKGGNITVMKKKSWASSSLLPNPTPIVDFIEKAVE
jgi:hypothetical protein